MPEQKDLTQTNTEQSESQENQETQDQQQQSQQQTQQQIDWENEQNPYKKRYGDSQGQVQPLVRTLQQFADFDHNTKTWKPKTQPASTQAQDADFEKILEGYDPEFRKALSGYTQKQIKDAIAEYHKTSVFQNEYDSGVRNSRSKAMEEFGGEFEFAKDGKMNPQSPLYQLADDIVQSKYVILNPDGSFAKYSTADAEYLATVEAYAILAKRSKQQPSNKGQLGLIKGKTTGSAAAKRQLSQEEYFKLSDADKDAYDLAQTEGR